jgi:hypothetical protein
MCRIWSRYSWPPKMAKKQSEDQRLSNAELVVVRTFLNKIDAEMAHSALEAAGIESIVSADDEGGLGPGLWMSGVRLLVRAEDAEQAGKILEA